MKSMLRLQTNSFRMLCEVTPQPICVFDPGSLYFLEINEAARIKYKMKSLCTRSAE